jgi:hypothetical protein
MAFYLNSNRLPEGVAFTDALGNSYPQNWLNLSTEEEKAAVGITWQSDPVRANDIFYWDGDTDLPKALEDKLEEDGSTTKGLKTQYVAQVKDTAGKLLNATDWYVIRKAERNVEVPSEVALKRTQVVAEANRLETDIQASSTVEALIEVLNAQNWSE